MKIIINIIVGFSLACLFNSCGIHDSYYGKVKNNIGDFSSIVKYISANKLFEINDSINKQNNITKNTSLYRSDLKDSILINFMIKYDIDRITRQKRNDNFYNNVIIFHKDYNPIMGKSKTIDFDFGVSPLRSRIQKGIKKDGGCYLKIIDENFIYSVNKNPSFGE
ncbi:hypothetical protein GKZ90_0022260 [Flavobacterium sp. MC2016-06]|uniref:hypothetical protein n=1 Tax=Flavobacterium sp. MC2016-06 TaxID=2676308 RepID=UPI0012BA85F4|nr:hypothetical protein [Flavobacterium sp. MC2016-06]MBU3861274.1 hypothetical protein [Flavobacterium sp. MC2016-06]